MKVCAICGKPNPNEHQAFCEDLGCSGRMVVKKRPGIQYITSLPNDEACVGMIEFKGQVLVATTKGVYVLEDDKLNPIRFVVEPYEITDEVPADLR